MAGCCNPTDYRRLFSRKYARRDARRFRQHGLRGTSRELVAAGRRRARGDRPRHRRRHRRDRAGAARRGRRARDERRALGRLRGRGGGADRRARRRRPRRPAGRRLRHGASVEPHDVVVMHRVVCCYPDVDTLVGKAAAARDAPARAHVSAGARLRAARPAGRSTSGCGCRAAASARTCIRSRGSRQRPRRTGLRLERRGVEERASGSRRAYRRMPV